MQNWLEQISAYVLGKALGSASGVKHIAKNLLNKLVFVRSKAL